jgi:hypothetical protein
MKRDKILKHEFVEYIPIDLKDGTIYVSMTFATVVHKCCCGCGNEVVTPLSPADWKLVFDGVSISLDPSIGNWGFDCKSHYWIRRNIVIWAPRWSQKELDTGRARAPMKKKYFEAVDTATDRLTKDNSGRLGSDKAERGFWRKLEKWWSQWHAS